MKQFFPLSCCGVLLAFAPTITSCVAAETPVAPATVQQIAATTEQPIAAAKAPAKAGAPSIVKVVKTAKGFGLQRNGQPYFIKGAGGDASKPLLKEIGGNSFRTWGADNISDKLDEAQKLGMTVTIGIWLGHKEHGFKYDDPAQVAAQLETAKRAITKYKDHPALLMWGIGNEMEVGQQDDPNVWKAVEEIAAFAKKTDPNHPTMTVVAEIGGDKVNFINKYCPSIDVIGINSYAGAQSIPTRYKKAGGVKPYAITEFGPGGTWEVGATKWGAATELTSTQKADWYRDAWKKAIADQSLSLGGYAFTWGNKQEATATWFGMLLSDGTRLAASDALSEQWTGKAPKNRVPALQSLKLQGADSVAPGATVKVTLDVSDPEGDPLKVDWIVQHDAVKYGNNGDSEAVPQMFPEAIVKSDNKSIEVKMPQAGGGYRIFAYVRDNHGGGAVANVPLFVEGGGKVGRTPAPKATLPFTISGETGDAPYIPSGYMGNAAAIKMTLDDTTNPHSGKSAIKVQYTAPDNWGGVVWQSPANDWGDLPGGWNLTGAQKLSFWARGEKGGEEVNFLFGLLGIDKKFHDSATAKLDKVKLTPEWKQYSIDISELDLSQIKTGFAWTLASTGQPITFYLDDIKYE